LTRNSNEFSVTVPGTAFSNEYLYR